MKLKKVAGILLAAGRSSRMKGANKLLLRYKGGTLLGRTVDELLKAGLSEVVVVTGHEATSIEAELGDRPVKRVFNPDFTVGMHSSIRRGLLALEDGYDAFFICLADQPGFDERVLRLLAEDFRRSPGDSILFPTFRGSRGHPVLISRAYKDEVLAHADGDFGCSYLFKNHPGKLIEVPVDDEHVVLDIDDRRDYERHGGTHAT